MLLLLLNALPCFPVKFWFLVCQ